MTQAASHELTTIVVWAVVALVIVGALLLALVGYLVVRLVRQHMERTDRRLDEQATELRGVKDELREMHRALPETFVTRDEFIRKAAVRRIAEGV